jgi:SagB-type dehydrogenase family enzyme
MSPIELKADADIELPEPLVTGGPAMWDSLRSRRSVRHYASRPMELESLSQLLWAAAGPVGKAPGGRILRTAPSAGGRYPIEIYPIANRVQGLRSGLYHYKYSSHVLSPLAYGDLGIAAAAAAMGQDACRQASVVFVLTAVFARTFERYHERALRYVFLDAGHVAENIALAAAGLGFGTCMLGAFLDGQLNELVRVDGNEEAAVYMVAAGVPSQ